MPLEDMLECYICMERYDEKQRIPKAVPCQHTICELCWKQNDRNEPLLKCPTCREPFQGDLKNCLHTKKLMDYVSHQEKIVAAKVNACRQEVKEIDDNARACKTAIDKVTDDFIAELEGRRRRLHEDVDKTRDERVKEAMSIELMLTESPPVSSGLGQEQWETRAKEMFKQLGTTEGVSQPRGHSGPTAGEARGPSDPVRDIQQMEMSTGTAGSHNPNRTSSLRNTRHGRPGDGNLLTRSAQGSDRLLRMGDRKITVKHIDKVPTPFYG